MCFSAIVEQRLSVLERRFGARIDEAAFESLFTARLDDGGIRIPKALERNFDSPATPGAQRIRELIERYRRERTPLLEAELFAQRKRLADAERALSKKATKTASESARKATKAIKRLQRQLADLSRTTPEERDSRIFPFHYAPVLLSIEGQTVIRPMRYHCRPAGKPSTFDRTLPGLYNARRDNLDRFWGNQFGHTHAVIVVRSFFENVARHDYEKRELAADEKSENIELHFNPKPAREMFVACLWSRWTAKDERPLESFAAVTDEPPDEIRATGHDRCIVALRPDNVGAWLQPGGRSSAELHALLEARDDFYYEHALAA